MNGRAVLLMTREMFLSRVPEGGGILFEDIQLKLQKVITELYDRTDASGGGVKAAHSVLAAAMATSKQLH